MQLRAVEMGISAPGDASRIANSSNPMAADLEAGSNTSKPASEQIVKECTLQPIASHLPSVFLV